MSYDLDKYMDDAPKSDRDKVKDGDIDDPRTNFRIARCCRNCTHFWYPSASPHRGYCKLPNPEEKAPFKKGGEKYDREQIEKNWLRVHMTNLCDNHEFRSQHLSIERVAKWTHKAFNEDGSPFE